MISVDDGISLDELSGSLEVVDVSSTVEELVDSSVLVGSELVVDGSDDVGDNVSLVLSTVDEGISLDELSGSLEVVDVS